MDRNTLIKVMFILQNPSRRTPIFSGLSASFVDVDPGIARADLLLELLDEHGSLGGWFEYSCDLLKNPGLLRWRLISRRCWRRSLPMRRSGFHG